MKITKANLQGAARMLARTIGRHLPEGCVKGAWIIESGSRTYGRAWALAEIDNDSGGQRDILRAATAQGLFDAIHAARIGAELAQNTHDALAAALRELLDDADTSGVTAFYAGKGFDESIAKARAVLAKAQGGAR